MYLASFQQSTEIFVFHRVFGYTAGSSVKFLISENISQLSTSKVEEKKDKWEEETLGYFRESYVFFTPERSNSDFRYNDVTNILDFQKYLKSCKQNWKRETLGHLESRYGPINTP